MTFKPTKARQKRWVRDYLNDGVCPKNKTLDWMYGTGMTACYEALEWLADSDIKTLAEAWERCPRPEWLVWCLRKMNSDRGDQQKAIQVFRKLNEMKFSSRRLRGGFSRPVDQFDKNKELETLALFRLQNYIIAYDQYFRPVERRAILKLIRETWGNPWVLKGRR